MKHELAIELMRTRFVEGALEPHQERALQIHIERCATCRQRYDKMQRLELALAEPLEPDGEVVPYDTEVSEHEARAELGARLSRSRRHRSGSRRGRWLGGAGLLAAAAAVLLVAWPQTEGFRARGGPPQGAQAWLRHFAKPADGAAREIEGAFSPTDGLLFAYTNLKTSPWRHLVVVGRDAKGQRYWYHPGYMEGEPDRSSVPIEVGVADRELPEAIYNDDGYPIGAFELCGVFSREALSARSLEARLAAGVGWPAEASVDCRTLEVRP